jgi:hypothetical protein
MPGDTDLQVKVGTVVKGGSTVLASLRQVPGVSE